jgi:hypothetical protein
MYEEVQDLGVLVAPQGFTNVANIRLIRFFHSDTLINTLR